MKIISSKVHGVLDYIVGILFLALPFLAGWDAASIQSKVLFGLGAFTIVYSLLTRYELGLFKIISLRAHLIIDLISGIFLAVSPWLMGFSDQVYLPHLLLGIFEIGASLRTKNSKSSDTIMG